MKKLILLSAAACLVAVPAYAQGPTATNTLTANASVPQTCYISTTPALVNGSNTLGVSLSAAGGGTDTATASATIPSANIINPVTATASATWLADYNSNTVTSGNVNFALSFSAVCNFADSDVSFRSANGGLTNASPPAAVGNFASRMSYTTRVTWGSNSGANAVFAPGATGGGGTVFGAGGGPSSQTITDPTNATLTVRFKLRALHQANGTVISAAQAPNWPVLSGSYSDTLTIRFSANP